MEKYINPVSKGDNREESNLWLACPICNSHKAGKIEVIDLVTDENAVTVEITSSACPVYGKHLAQFPYDKDNVDKMMLKALDS